MRGLFLEEELSSIQLRHSHQVTHCQTLDLEPVHIYKSRSEDDTKVTRCAFKPVYSIASASTKAGESDTNSRTISKNSTCNLSQADDLIQTRSSAISTLLSIPDADLPEFDMMSFARMTCNNKSGVLSNSLFCESACSALRRLKAGKQVVE